MRVVVAVAMATLRQLGRRRTMLALLVLLPLAFYVARRDLEGQSVRLLALGVAWAVSTVALFAASGARAVEQRLRFAGATAVALLAGRLMAVVALGAALGGTFLLVVAVDQDVERLWAVALLLGISVVVAVALGSAIGALLPQELEGAIALLVVVGVQMIADPAGTVAKLLPFWSTRELATFAVDATDRVDLWQGVGHASATVAVLVAGTTLVTTWRLRLHPAAPAADDGVGLHRRRLS